MVVSIRSCSSRAVAVTSIRCGNGNSGASTWIDARTLFVSGRDSEYNFQLRWFVDGKLDEGRTLTVKPSEWTLKKGKTIDDILNMSIGSPYGQSDDDPTSRAVAAATAVVLPAVVAYERGATILRVHDVREHVEALTVARAVAAPS